VEVMGRIDVDGIVSFDGIVIYEIEGGGIGTTFL
jgi:hypothetical protein